MKKNLKAFAFALLILGTLGLLINELVFTWGSNATLIFATANIIGLVMLGLSYRSKR